MPPEVGAPEAAAGRDDRPAILVVGAGKAGRMHLGVAAARRDRTVLVHDRDPAVAEAAAAEMGACAVADPRQARRTDRDLAIVCTPPSDHLDRLTDLAALGFAVLVEKPLAATPEQARALVAHAAGRPGRVEAVCQHRFSDGVATLGRRLDDGLRVDAVRLTIRRRRTAETFRRLPWRLRREVAGGGVLMAIGFHAVDVASALFGQPRLIAVRDWAFTGEVESAVRLTADLGGIPFEVDAAWGDVEGLPDTLRLDTAQGPLTLAGGALSPGGVAGVDRPTLHRRQLDAVLAALDGRAPPVVPPAAVMPALDLIFDAYRRIYAPAPAGAAAAASPAASRT